MSVMAAFILGKNRGPRTCFTIPLWAGSLLLASSIASAELDYYGQNTLGLEYYDVDGDSNQALYSDEGGQSYDDLSVNFSDTYSAYSGMQGYFLLNNNYSSYRGDRGTRLTNASVKYQNGESDLPYRLEVGDFFATQSRRTLQRGIKGLQLELQPRSKNTPQSIQLFLGRSAADYDQLFDGAKDYYLGGSWLGDVANAGTFSVVSVDYNNPGTNGEYYRENVSSIAWARDFTVSRFYNAIETELAYLSGENVINDSLTGKSSFIKLSGYDAKGYNYLLSYENNNEDFMPAGAAVTADREAIDVQWGQAVSQGLQARLRGQRYRDFLSTDNNSIQRIYGLNLYGLPFSSSQININLDVYNQRNWNETKSIDRNDDVLQFSAVVPGNDHWRNRIGYQWRKTKNYNSSTDFTRQSVTLGLDYSFSMRGWMTTFSPTINVVNDVDVNNNQSDNLSLGLVIDANKNDHRFLFSHQKVDYRAEDPSALKSETLQTRLQWRKDWNQNLLAVNADWFTRNPDDGIATDSNRFSFTWTYRFQKPSAFTAATYPQNFTLTKFTRIDDLAIYSPFNSNTTDVLEASGWTAAGNRGRYAIYEGKLLSQINSRQVLAIENSAASIDATHLLLPFGPQKSSRAAEELYEKVLDSLIKTYGAPSLEISKGAFNPNWLKQLFQNRFSRIVEWKTSGGILRFGIPKPRANEVRMELQLRNQHPAPNSSDWGLSIIL